MNFREIMNNNSGVTTIGAVLLLIAALTYTIMSMGDNSPRRHKQRWFYDTKTKQLFADEIAKVTPFTTESGGEGVTAMVYTCDDCDVQSLKIQLLTKFTDEYRDQMLDYRKRMESNDLSDHERMMGPGMMGPGMMGPGMGNQTLYAFVPQGDEEIQWTDDPSVLSARPECPEGSKPKRNCYPD